MRLFAIGIGLVVLSLGSVGVRADDADKVPPPDPTPPAANPPAEAKAPADAGVPAAAPGGDAAPANADEAAAALRARYRFVNGEWWFYTNTKGWKIYRNQEWIDFDPATYQPPVAATAPATSSGGTTYYTQPSSNGYRSGGTRLYIGTGFGYSGFGPGYGYGAYPYGGYRGGSGMYYGGRGVGIGIGFGGGGRRW